MVMKAGVAAIAALLILLSAPGSAGAQCAMCRRALDSPEGRQLAAALRSGILVLLAAPFVLFAGVATLAVRSQRARLARADAGRPAEDQPARRCSLSDVAEWTTDITGARPCRDQDHSSARIRRVRRARGDGGRACA